ncbi:MAG: hypothetical protein FJW63_08415 [Actinobacteria bacterium]|nr:hypothetical protein [Actinomycetota bacterium]
MIKYSSAGILILIIMISGCINQYTTPQDVNESGGKHSNGEITFNYPDTWKLEHIPHTEYDFYSINSTDGINDNTTFIIDKVFTDKSLQELYGEERKYALNSQDKIIYERNLTMDGAPAYELMYEGQLNSTNKFQRRIFMVKKYSETYKKEVLYYIVATAPSWNNESIKDFDMVINTFKIL